VTRAPDGGVVLWRRLDVPGHDACRLTRDADGWRVEGAAVFRHHDGPARLAYAVSCDAAWHTREGRVDGWVGGAPVAIVVRRDGGRWTLNGAPVAGLDDRTQLDFGFTPATNLFQLRRLALDVGQGGDAPVAWLDVPAAALSPLDQRYERRAPDAYWYDAPRFDYSATLVVRGDGFVCRYPGLWECEPGE
jgi:hypothetical protein